MDEWLHSRKFVLLRNDENTTTLKPAVKLCQVTCSKDYTVTLNRPGYTYQVVADSNFKYVLEIKDVPKFKDART